MSMFASTSDESTVIEPNVAHFAIHDLKGAVHAIQGFLSVLSSEQAGPLTETQHDFLMSAFITARRIERLVGDLQVAELGERSLSLIPADCDLAALLRMCMRELEPTAIGFDVRVELDVDERRDWHIVVDPVRLEQIAFNMIENAIRYAAADTTVIIRLRQSHTRLLLVVENTVADPTGLDMTRLFEPFQRGKPANVSNRRGTGIGLSVVQVLVTAFGGRTYARVRDTTVSIAASLPRQTWTVEQLASD